MKKMICPKCGLALLTTKRKRITAFCIKLATMIAPLGKHKCEECLLKKVEDRLFGLFFVWSN